ncbi:MAG: MFS transporter, partial [Bacteroidota bacterium]
MAISPRKHDTDVEDRAGYLELLRTNADYRRLWLGSSLSLLGDWFNLIALYTLVSTLTGSPLAIGVIFLAKMLPWALAAPVAGLIVDRYNRRRLMIGADLIRSVIVLGFLLI